MSDHERPERPKLVDGPGCTPALSPGREAALRVLRASGAIEDQEPADIPVRRRVDGRWKTVMVTLSDFRANEGADGRHPVRVLQLPEEDT